MKNKIKLFGTQSRMFCAISLLAAIAFSMAACDSGFGGGGTDPILNGTWVMETWRDGSTVYLGSTFTLNNGNFEYVTLDDDRDLVPDNKGTYTTNGSNLTITTTHASGGDLKWYGAVYGRWYSRAELRTLGVPEEELNQIFPPPLTAIYYISGNALYLTGNGVTNVYHKR